MRWADASGRTALHVAAFAGSPPLCMFCLHFGADVDARDLVGASPLYETLASYLLCPSVARLLLDHGAKPGEDDVKMAVKVGIPSLVAMLLQQAGAPAPPGVPRSLAAKACSTPQGHHLTLFATRAFLFDAIVHHNTLALDAAVRTGAHDLGLALAVCACLGTVEQMLIVLKAGADCNARLRAVPASIFDGGTALHCAAAGGFQPPDPGGRGPLAPACGLEARDEFVKVLVDAGADVNAALPCGLTPLDVARHLSVRATLRGLGARHAAQEVRATPAASSFRAALDSVEAIRTQQIARFKQFIADGVDPGMTDLAGETALHVLVRAKHASALIFWLVQAGADVHRGSFTDSTPLHHAVRAGDERLVDVLLACGADPTACDWLGFCPARLAAYEQQVGCFRAITEHLVVRRRAEAAQEVGGAERCRGRGARRPPRRRAPATASAISQDEYDRRAAASEAAARQLLAEEEVQKQKERRAAERRLRRAKQKRHDAVERAASRLSDDGGAADTEGEGDLLREPPWLAQLLGEDFDVPPREGRRFVETRVRAAPALAAKLVELQRCAACLDAPRRGLPAPEPRGSGAFGLWPPRSTRR